MEADDAAGVRWKKKTTDGAIITEKYYLENIEYNGTNLEAIYHSDGQGNSRFDHVRISIIISLFV